MRPRRIFIFVIVAIVALGGGVAWWWHVDGRNRIIHASVPTTPALPAFPAELAQRVSACEQAVRSAGGIDGLANLAQLYHANGFLPEAVQCYRGLAELDASNARWPHRLASIYAGYGRLDDAVSLWQRTLRLAPDYVAAGLRLGDARAKLNRPAEAATAYTAVLARELENVFALTGLARLDLAAGRTAPAREKLERAAARSGGRIGSDLLATVCEQLGDTARATALRTRAKATGAFHDPPDPWLEEIFADCFDVYRLTVAAGFAEHAGDSAQAQRLIARALTLEPANASALYQRGTFAVARRELDAAQRDFEACVAAAPDHADAWWRLIHTATARGDTATAARALAAGLARCPDSPTLHLERATRLAATGRTAEALAELETVVRLRPTDADTLVKMAETLFRLERIEDGVVALQRALAAEPEHPLALTTLALHAIGFGDEATARDWLARIRAQPRTPSGAAAALAEEFRRKFGRAP